MSETVRVQIPLESKLYELLEQRIQVYGFSSVQAYLKVIIKAEVDNRKVHFDEPVLEDMSRAAIRVIETQFHEHLVTVLNEEADRFKSIDDAIKYVHDRYRRQQALIYLHQIIDELDEEG